MIYNRPRRAKKKQLTWVINESPTIPQTKSYYDVGFESGDFSGVKKGVRIEMGFETMFGCFYITYRFSKTVSAVNGVYVYNVNQTGWKDQAYRTITFDTEPTGDLLTWLEANATPQ